MRVVPNNPEYKDVTDLFTDLMNYVCKEKVDSALIDLLMYGECSVEVDND